jgi:hypothetical protein
MQPQMTNPWDAYRGAAGAIAPLCVRCEKDYGKAIGGWGDINRDRRILRQVSALAEVIQTTAYRIEKGLEKTNGRA